MEKVSTLKETLQQLIYLFLRIQFSDGKVVVSICVFICHLIVVYKKV